MIKNIKNTVQIHKIQFFSQRKSSFSKNFRFSKNQGLFEDCKFIDKTLIYVQNLKIDKIFNLNKKLKKMIFLFFKELLVKNDNRDCLIILWDLYQKNNLGIFTNFKKFGNYLKNIINFKNQESKFGICFFLLNLKKFNLSDFFKLFLINLFNSLNLQFFKK